MTNEQIEKFLDPKHLATTVVKIDFKTRNSIMGIFLKTNDYTDLKQKNWNLGKRAMITALPVFSTDRNLPS
jgi:hypothetical protein